MTDRTVTIRLSMENAEKIASELAKLGKDGQAALKLLEDGAEGPNKGLLALDRAMQSLGDRALSAADGLGPLSAGLSAFGTIGLVASAGIGLIATALTTGAFQAAEYDEQLRNLEGTFRSLQYSAGVTAQDVAALAQEIERASKGRLSEEEVLQSARSLSAFPNINGDDFIETLRLAGDIAGTRGEDLVQWAQRLGAALNDPEQGLSSLRETLGGVEPALQRTVDEMIVADDQAGALAAIIDHLSGRFQGGLENSAQGAESSIRGVYTAFKDATQAAAEFLNAGSAIDVIAERMTKGFEGVSDFFRGGDRERPFQDDKEDLARLEQQLDLVRSKYDELKQRSDDLPAFLGPGGLGIRIGSEAPLLREIEGLEERIADIKAEAAADTGAAENKRRQAVSALYELERENIDELQDAELSKVEALQMARQQAIDVVEAYRVQAGDEAADKALDAINQRYTVEIEAAQDAENKKLELAQARLDREADAQLRALDRANAAAERQVQRQGEAGDYLRGLQREAEALKLNRRERVAFNAAFEAEVVARRAGINATDDYVAAIVDAQVAIEDARIQAQFLIDPFEQAQEAAEAFGSAAISALDGVKSGSFDAMSVVEDLGNAIIDSLILKPLYAAISSGFTSLFSGLIGGIGGTGAASGFSTGLGASAVSAGGFSSIGSSLGGIGAPLNIPGFSSGTDFTVPGSGAGGDDTLVMFRAQGQERVKIYTPDQNRRGVQGSGMGGGGMTVNIIDKRNSGEQPQVSQRQGSNGLELDVIIEDATDAALQNGRFDQALATNFGLNRKGTY